MKMAKASEKNIDAAGNAMSVLNDIDAAGNAMRVLNDISSGYYPKRDGDDCEDLHFDPDEPAHLRKFFNLMADTLDRAPGWPSRVIGGMCYVLLFDKNKIVDPDADGLELHPRFSQVQQERDELLEACIQTVEENGHLADGENCTLIHLVRAITKVEGGAA